VDWLFYWSEKRGAIMKNVKFYGLITLVVVSLSFLYIGCDSGGGGSGSDGSSSSSDGLDPEIALQLGNWSGDDISFKVSQGSYLVEDLSITYKGRAVGTICSYDYTVTSNIEESILVENNSIIYDTESLTIDGTFIDEQYAEIFVSWLKYNSKCDATESGSKIYQADYDYDDDDDDTSIRFFNNLTCNGASFTANLSVCGSVLSSVSGSWSSCKGIDPGSCPISLHVTMPPCSPIDIDTTLTLDPDCIYDFVLNFDGTNVVLGYRRTCSGDCSIPPPSSGGESFRQLTADDSFEVLMEIPIEGQGFTLYQ